MFNKRVRIKEILGNGVINHELTVMGWVRTFQKQPIYCTQRWKYQFEFTSCFRTWKI